MTNSQIAEATNIVATRGVKRVSASSLEGLGIAPKKMGAVWVDALLRTGFLREIQDPDKKGGERTFLVTASIGGKPDG